MGEWALRTACRDAARWPNSGHGRGQSFAACSSASTIFAEKIHAILLETGLSPRRLEVEVTESTVMSDQTRGLHDPAQAEGDGHFGGDGRFRHRLFVAGDLHAFPFDKINSTSPL